MKSHITSFELWTRTDFDLPEPGEYFVYDAVFKVCKARFDGHSKWTIRVNGTNTTSRPTHWMYMPDDPDRCNCMPSDLELKNPTVYDAYESMLQAIARYRLTVGLVRDE